MAESATKAPSFEIGYVNPHGLDWAQWDEDERVPDLQWPQSVHVYRRMNAEDGRITSVMQAITLPILRTAWRIDPNGARDEVVEFVAKDLGLPITGADAPKQRGRVKGRFSWREHLQQASLSFVFGHSYFEQVYRIEGEGARARAHLRKLAPRPQATISRITVARDGGLVSIVQSPAVGDTLTVPRLMEGGEPIPVSRLVAYRRDPEPGDWIGRSMLRPAYKHWLLKDEFMRIEAAAARRNGIGVPVFWAPPGSSDEDVRKYQQLASRYRGGETSGVGLPADAKAALLGVSGNLPDIRHAIEYHDKSIALAGLAHFLNLDRGGSYALASVQSDVFTQAEQSHAEALRDTAQAHVVEDLVDLNFGEDEPAPMLAFDEIGSRQDLTAAAFKTLIDAGLIRADPLLEAFVRQQYGMPPAETDDEPDEPYTPPSPVPPPSTEPDRDQPAAPVAASARAQGTLF